MFTNILIATDGSELAERAVSHGVSLAKLAGTKVTALIVEPSFNVFGVPESQVRQMPDELLPVLGSRGCGISSLFEQWRAVCR
jgi:nucleotide-binding universal stress UspA family protein